MKVLVLGGYGLIGEAVLGRLIEDATTLSGSVVTSAMRGGASRSYSEPVVQWIAADMSRLLAAADWIPLLAGVEAVVNAAGALQDGPPRSSGGSIGGRSPLSSLLANRPVCADWCRFPRSAPISIPITRSFGPRPKVTAPSRRPPWNGLSCGPAWSLRRALMAEQLCFALAAFPWLVPAVLADRPIQTVSVADVAEAVSRAVGGVWRAGRSSTSSRNGPGLLAPSFLNSGPGSACPRRRSWRCRRLSAGSPAWSPMGSAFSGGDHPCAVLRLPRSRRALPVPEILGRNRWSPAATVGSNAGDYAGACSGAVVRAPLVAEAGRVCRLVCVLAGFGHCRVCPAGCGRRHSHLARPVWRPRTRDGFCRKRHVRRSRADRFAARST